MDSSGAVIGLIIAAIIVYLIPGDKFHLTKNAYHWMIIIAIVPAVLAVVILMTLVQERKKIAAASNQVFPKRRCLLRSVINSNSIW